MVSRNRDLVEGVAALEVGGDAGGSEAVVAYLCPDTGRCGAPTDHGAGVGLGKWSAGELVGAAADGLEERTLRAAPRSAPPFLPPVGFSLSVLPVSGSRNLNVVMNSHMRSAPDSSAASSRRALDCLVRIQPPTPEFSTNPAVSSAGSRARHG